MIDGSIGLDKVVDIIVRTARPPDRTDHTAGNRRNISERGTDGEHNVANLYCIGISQFGDGNVFLGSFKRNQRNVPALVAADKFAFCSMPVI